MLHACRPAIGLPYRPYCITIERCVGHTDHGMTICLSHNKHGHIDRLLPVPYIDRLLPVPCIDRLLPVPYIDRRLPVPYIDTLLADRRNAIAFRFTPTSCVPNCNKRRRQLKPTSRQRRDSKVWLPGHAWFIYLQMEQDSALLAS